MKRDELLAVGMFPVLIGMSIHNEGQVCVPFSIVEPHEKQAIANHSQKLWTLASRGGLSPGELAAVLEDRPHKAMPVHEAWQVIYRAIAQRALEAAAEVCEKHCTDLLHDKDIQKHWPRIKAENDNYAALIRAMAKELT